MVTGSGDQCDTIIEAESCEELYTKVSKWVRSVQKTRRAERGGSVRRTKNIGSGTVGMGGNNNSPSGSVRRTKNIGSGTVGMGSNNNSPSGSVRRTKNIGSGTVGMGGNNNSPSGSPGSPGVHAVAKPASGLSRRSSDFFAIAEDKGRTDASADESNRWPRMARQAQTNERGESRRAQLQRARERYEHTIGQLKEKRDRLTLECQQLQLELNTEGNDEELQPLRDQYNRLLKIEKRQKKSLKDETQLLIQCNKEEQEMGDEARELAENIARYEAENLSYKQCVDILLVIEKLADDALNIYSPGLLEELHLLEKETSLEQVGNNHPVSESTIWNRYRYAFGRHTSYSTFVFSVLDGMVNLLRERRSHHHHHHHNKSASSSYEPNETKTLQQINQLVSQLQEWIDQNVKPAKEAFKAISLLWMRERESVPIPS